MGSLAQYDDEDMEKFFSVVWKMQIPPKVAFLIWKILLDKLPTKDNLAHSIVVGVEIALKLDRCLVS